MSKRLPITDIDIPILEKMAQGWQDEDIALSLGYCVGGIRYRTQQMRWRLGFYANFQLLEYCKWFRIIPFD